MMMGGWLVLLLLGGIEERVQVITFVNKDG